MLFFDQFHTPADETLEQASAPTPTRFGFGFGSLAASFGFGFAFAAFLFGFWRPWASASEEPGTSWAPTAIESPVTESVAWDDADPRPETWSWTWAWTPDGLRPTTPVAWTDTGSAWTSPATTWETRWIA